MKSFFVGLLMGFFFTLAQIGFFRGLSLWGSAPNLILLAIFCLIFFGAYKTGFWLAFFGGIFLDIFLVARLGVSSIVLLSLGLIFYFLITLIGRSAFIFCIATFLGSISWRLLFTLKHPFPENLFKEALLTTIFLLIFYYPFQLVRSFLAQKTYIQLKMHY